MEKTKCPLCEKGRMIKKKVDFSIYGIKLGKFEAEVCNECSETFFDEKISEKMDKIAKEKGVWGLGIKTRITRTGNSLAVRIPKKIVDFLKLKEGEETFIHPSEGNKIVIEAKS